MLDRWVSPRVRRQVEELGRELDRFGERSVPALRWFVSDLAKLLGAEAGVAYALSRQGDGWALDFMHTQGVTPARATKVFTEALAKRGDTPALYAPAAPQPKQRNRAAVARRGVRQTKLHGTAAHQAASAVGLGDKDVLRVLVCDGPMMLAWVGGYRDQRFDGAEQAILQALVPQLRRRLQLERKLAAYDRHVAVLDHVLDALPAPAFIARRSGHIEFVNAAGHQLLERGASRLRAAIARAIAEQPHGVDYQVTPVARASSACDTPELFLVLRALGPESARFLHHWAADWRLTPRQSETLQHLVTGDSNAVIAAKLGCALRTAELHVTALLRKSGCDSRAELIARFWTPR